MNAKETQRIELTAKNGKEYSDKMVQSLARTQALVDANFNAQLKAVEDNQAVWVDFEGVLVLRVKDSIFVAVPTNGKKNSAKFDIINIQTRELGCQLKNSEVYGWLCKVSID